MRTPTPMASTQTMDVVRAVPPPAQNAVLVAARSARSGCHIGQCCHSLRSANAVQDRPCRHEIYAFDIEEQIELRDGGSKRRRAFLHHRGEAVDGAWCRIGEAPMDTGARVDALEEHSRHLNRKTG